MQPVQKISIIKKNSVPELKNNLRFNNDLAGLQQGKSSGLAMQIR